jgi:8-oxo-dGTP diphosphatase
VVKDGRILLLKRKKPPYAGHWGMVGGKIEHGEHIEDAALRETKEETGIDARFVELRGIASEILRSGDVKKAHFLLYVCELAPKHTDNESGEEGESAWFRLDSIEKMKSKIIPSDYLMIKEFVLGKKSAEIYKVDMVEEDGGYSVRSFHK